MTDKYGRTIQYLRLSVTDRCNLRCIYCMAEEGVCKLRHEDILTIEELTEIAYAAYRLGVRKIRLTGGDPLVRKGVLTLCKNIKAIDPEIELVMTTNGILLSQYAKELKKAGVDRLNISLDTLDPDVYTTITRRGRLSDALAGIEAAADAGFTNIKINTVLIGGVNDGEILRIMALAKDSELSVRFIELMPMDLIRLWDKSRFVSTDLIEQYFKQEEIICYDGVAKLYRPAGYKGTVGIISPLSNSFCDRCDKIRVTADGKLKPCLHSGEEIDLRGLSGDELVNAMRRGILSKPKSHDWGDFHSGATRGMNEIGG